jgi:RNA polymerase sigma-70 factor (ECF subfamily)
LCLRSLSPATPKMRVIATNCTQGVTSNIPRPASDRDFTSAMRAHQPKLYRTACFLTGDHHEGEDLLQETLLEAWKSWNSFEDRSSVYTWVYRILIRRYHRWQRRQIVRRMFFVSAVDQKESQTFIDPSELPGSLMEHDEQNAQLWKLLASLRPKHREVLVLRYAESMRLEQIADALRMPLGTVKSRLNHAHAQVREKLKRAALYVTSYELPRGPIKHRANRG